MEHCRHPLDSIYPNNSLLLLEAMIPYVEPSLRLPLALLIKIQEIQFILNAFHNPQTMKACGFDNTASNTEDMLLALCQAMGFDLNEQLKNAQNIQTMMNHMQTFQASSDIPSDFQPDNHADSYHSTNDALKNNSAQTESNEDFSNSRDEMINAIRDILAEQKQS